MKPKTKMHLWLALWNDYGDGENNFLTFCAPVTTEQKAISLFKKIFKNDYGVKFNGTSCELFRFDEIHDVACNPYKVTLKKI